MRRWWMRHMSLVLADAVVVIIALVASYFIRFDGDIPANHIENLPILILVSVIIRLVVFHLAGLYRSLWKYASVRELIVITGATAGSTLLLYVINNIANVPATPRFIYLIDFLIVLFGIGFIRFSVRLRRQYLLQTRRKEGKQVLIFGAGEAGTRLLEEFQSQPELNIRVVGFVDDDTDKVNRTIHGVSVLGTRHDIPSLVETYEVEQMIIAMPSVKQSTIHEIVAECRALKVELQILPPIEDILNGRVRVQDIRPVEIEDLLRRDPIQTDLSSIREYITERRVLVTGAGGSIGRELCRQISLFQPKELILLGHGENSIFETNNELREDYPDLHFTNVIADIRDKEKIERLFRKHRPQVVFHAAAHKHVPLMEENPDEAVENNVFGTRHVAEAAHAFHAECFVMVSTDKAVNPGNVMGATKRVAEMFVQSLAQRSDTRFVSVRFGNVLGSRGSVIPMFRKQIAQGGPVTVTHPEMKRYFMTIPEAVQLVLQAGALGQGGEVFVLDMGEPVKIVDLARDLITLSGFEPDKDIKIEFTGTRPGEKLFEELVNSGEDVLPTRHEKIVQLQGDVPKEEEMDVLMGQLREYLRQDDLEQLKATLYSVTNGTEQEHHAVTMSRAEAVSGWREAASGDDT